MTVLHVITSLDDGGAQAALYRLIGADTMRRHVVVSLSDTGKYAALLQAGGTSVIALNMPRGRLTLRGVSVLWQTMRREQPAIVQTWMYHANLLGGLVARLAGIKNVCWGLHHTDHLAGSTRWGTRLVDQLCAILSGQVPRRIVACAETAKTAHIARGYVAEKLVVIPNGYDVSRFAPDGAERARVRDELGITPKETAVGLIARWDPQKDHATFVAAMSAVLSRVPAVSIVMAGQGCISANETLGQLIRAAGLGSRVHLLGSRSDVPALLNALDLLVLSSAYGEAFPNVVAEAMACGTPCVVTSVGDAPLIVGTTGWVVPARNPPALAEAILLAIAEAVSDADSWRRRQLSARHAIVARFALDNMVGGYAAAWGGGRPR